MSILPFVRILIWRGLLHFCKCTLRRTSRQSRRNMMAHADPHDSYVHGAALHVRAEPPDLLVRVGLPVPECGDHVHADHPVPAVPVRAGSHVGAGPPVPAVCAAPVRADFPVS
eukprot:5958115-Pyramimonas_sp.AAC.1